MRAQSIIFQRDKRERKSREKEATITVSENFSNYLILVIFFDGVYVCISRVATFLRRRVAPLEHEGPRLLARNLAPVRKCVNGSIRK